MSLKQKNLIYGDLEKRKVPYDIIYRLLHHYQSYFFIRRYLTANYCLGSKGCSRKQNKPINNLKKLL